ncbi:hypothetical protein F4782DRAFT_509336, partial [Xylaria castorea]
MVSCRVASTNLMVVWLWSWLVCVSAPETDWGLGCFVGYARGIAYLLMHFATIGLSLSLIRSRKC